MLLQIRNLKKIYFSEGKAVSEALRDISLDIHEGEILGLLGPNGAGKTTQSTILATLHPPSAGQILWKGVSIYKNLLSYRKWVGFCPQKPNLDRSFTLEENLVFAGRCYGLSKKQAQAQKERLLDQLDLRAYRLSYVDFLSGGYKQRFLLARTLMHRPRLVILDEPTVGLDPQIRRQIWSIIAELKKEGVTVVLTSHYLDEIEELADRVCILDKGLIRLIDTPDHLKKTYQKGSLEDVFLQLLSEEDKNSGW